LRSLVASLFLFCSTLLLAQEPASAPASTQTTSANKVVHVLGMEGVPRNAKGELVIRDGALEFQTPTGKSQIKISAIEDVATGQDSKQVGGTPLMLVKLAAPFGSGRALSLFAHQKVDNLTVEFRDENNGFHGAIFVLAKGQAAQLKKELVAQGAHATSAISDEAAQPAGKKVGK
jgi:hypothetical protein